MMTWETEDRDMWERAEAIAECIWCDHRGRLSGEVICYHDEDPEIRKARAAERAQAAALLIRPTRHGR